MRGEISLLVRSLAAQLEAVRQHHDFLGGSLAKRMDSLVQKLDGANMDIDLVTPVGQIKWKQDPCPWNEAEKVSSHKCAEKNVSICPYFCGIEYLDNVLCCYPNENPLQGAK
jgi:hypothetical protein